MKLQRMLVCTMSIDPLSTHTQCILHIHVHVHEHVPAHVHVPAHAHALYMQVWFTCTYM